MNAPARPGRLHDEVVAVTGGTSSLGAGIARRCAAEGAAVAVVGRDRTRGERVVESVKEAGGEACFVATDIRDPTACERAVGEIGDALGNVSVLVNCAKSNDPAPREALPANAGGPTGGPTPEAWKTGDGNVVAALTDTWEQLFAVNVFGVAFMCRAAIPRMIERGGGAVVNISSRTAERGTPGIAVYSASKGAIHALTRSIAVDFAADGIRCNAIAAGYIEHATRDDDMPEDRRAFFGAQHLTPRLGVVDDIANAVVYLASPESGFVTGEILFVDGGGASTRARTVG